MDWGPARCAFIFPPDRYRIAKPEPEEEKLYVLVSEHDCSELNRGIRGSRPIIWEQYADRGAASLQETKALQARLGTKYGKTRIARLQFIE